MKIDEILAKTNQGKDVFEYYLGYPIDAKKKYLSATRNEKTASASFKTNTKGEWKYQDFGDPNYMSCFHFVSKLFGIGVRDAVLKIREDMFLSSPSFMPRVIQNVERKTKEIITTIAYKPMQWTYDDICYWKEYNVNREALEYYGFVPVKEYTITNEDPLSIYRNHKNPLIYAIPYPSGNIKIYQPLNENKRYKCIGTSKKTDILGLTQLANSEEYIAIVAGQKDLVSLYANTGIKGISLNSETISLEVDTAIALKLKSEKVFVLYDNDPTGIKEAKKLNLAYNFPIVDLSKISTVKDVSDYFKAKCNKETLLHLIKKSFY